MTRISWRSFHVVVAVVCVLASVWGLAGRGQARKPVVTAIPQGDKGKDKFKTLYFGYTACARCHDRKQDDPYQDPMYPPVCRCTEVQIWLGDKHKASFKNALQSEQGQRIGQRLGYEKKVSEDGRCLSCHGVNDSDKNHFDPSFKDPAVEGVTCVVCHGPADRWVEDHAPVAQAKKEAWRKLSREQKEKEYGMTDLWNPANRTRKCVSCHVGNVQEGKFVSHDMYAAGHPPLPGIEIATFSDDMPKHWQYIKEKTPAVQKLLGFDPTKQKYEKSKLVAASSIVALAESIRLVADQAETVSKATNPEKQLLDFAVFDCYACHHDLRTPSWRQERGYVGKPGRPQMRPWPTALAGVSLQELALPQGAGRGLEDGLMKLDRAFSLQPFGDSQAIGVDAKTLADSLNRLGDEAAKDDKQLDEAQVQTLLRQLCSHGEKRVLDYDSARQVAWAFRIIYDEWKPAKAANSEITAQIEALHKYLKLDLPSGTDKSILGELPISLQKLNDYNPEKFKEHMQKLSKLLQQG